MDSLPGFGEPVNIDDSKDDAKPFKKSAKKSGGFQSMGLSFNVLKGITRRGYKIPTPIQRKTIPLVMEGRDVVAMARTGSGKTAAFLIPLFEKLKMRTAKAGARALILSPTRELALQTLKFAKELGKFTGLKSAVILGGDSMDGQFAAIHGNPDVIIATPGRFLHVCIEMDLKLNSLEYVVFDEADRLFEMGLGEQLTEVVNRLPDSRQTVLFSATLPKVMVDFAKVGLHDPVLIRLDVESKLPTELELFFIILRPEERVAALLVLLKSVIEQNQQTVVFAPTKHHVEYLHMVLDKVGIPNTYIYSDLDPSARKINAAKFSQNKVKILIVTDVAARGIDIPQLDNVINFNFPAKPKLFVHRVGRCARAGRSGKAYSFIAPDEYAFLVDLHLFLGRPLAFYSKDKQGNIGRVPELLIEEQQATLVNLIDQHSDLISMANVVENAYQQYSRCRPTASSDSNKRVKQMNFATCNVLHIFNTSEVYKSEENKQDLLNRMKNYRPQGTIFEVCSKNKSQDYIVMKTKKALHKDHIEAFHKKLQEQESEQLLVTEKPDVNLPASSSEDIESTFAKVVLPKKRSLSAMYTKKFKKQKIDENFIPYTPLDKHTEEGLSVNSFQREAEKVEFSLTGDSQETMHKPKQTLKWDRKKKKLIANQSNSKVGKIRTESGVWIPASYKGNKYAQWKQRTKTEENDHDDNMDEEQQGPAFKNATLRTNANTHWANHNKKVLLKRKRSEMRSTDQIFKAREIAEKKKLKQKKGKSGRKGKKK